jgi:potassium efflux system protein
VPAARLLCGFLIANVIALLAITVSAQTPPPASPPPAKPPAAAEAQSPAAIPLPEVATQAELASASLRDIERAASAVPVIEAVGAGLPRVTRQIDGRAGDTSKLLARNPSFETLRSIEADWQQIRDTLSGWTRGLTREATRVERQINRLEELSTTWEQTLSLAKTEDSPPEVLRRVESVIAEIARTRELMEKRRAQVLAMQSRVARQDARVAQSLTDIREAREDAVTRLVMRDSPPIWGGDVRARVADTLAQDTQQSFAARTAALASYTQTQRAMLGLQLLIFMLSAGVLLWIRNQVRVSLVQEHAIEPVARVFEAPLATAALFALALGFWLYPQAPSLLWSVLGALALIPMVVLLRQLVEPRLFPLLNALAVCYFADILRDETATLFTLARLMFIVELASAIVFLIWLIKAMQRPLADGVDRVARITRICAYVALVLLAAALCANALGYVTLSNVLGESVLASAYAGFILYAAMRVIDGLIMMALRTGAAAKLAMVRRHRPLLQQRLYRIIQWLAIFGWLVFALDRLSLWRPLIEALPGMFTTELTLGALALSPGDVLAFVAAVWAAFLLSRFLRFVLEEEVYPRVYLARGLPYAVSTVLHYIVLFVGFLAGLAALGVDMTKVTILAGAFSLGLGFGLQNIVNNFVSGLIVLFERPINVGDAVQIDDATGVVERIGIRASSIRMSNGSEVIIPNGKLISDRVINWTRSNRRRRIEIPVATALGTDPKRVIELLEGIASGHAKVARDPAPKAVVVKLGADSLGFELRAWTELVDEWSTVRSDLAVAINDALAAENVTIK